MRYRIEVEEEDYDVEGWFSYKRVTRYAARGYLQDCKGRDLNWFNEAFTVQDTQAEAIRVCTNQLKAFKNRLDSAPQKIHGEF